MTSDLDLLRQFARENSQDAFTALVNRHVNLVYTAALRQVRSPQVSEEIAQSVFADLARDAGKLKADTILTAWLYSVTRRTAIDAIRKESRRQLREQIAVEMNDMNSTANEWTQIEPLLDDAMAALDETDRAAILLRYFENKSLREVGESLKISDDAAQKRVSRAVEKLREFFSKQKITVGASGLAVLISANAVQSAPAGLAATISAAAVLAGTAVHTSTIIAATKTIAMTTIQKTIIGATVAVAVGTGIFEAHQVSQLHKQNQILQQEQSPLAEQIQQLQLALNDATNQLAESLAENVQLKSNSNENELLKLRGEVTQLRNDAKELAQLKSAKSESVAPVASFAPTVNPWGLREPLHFKELENVGRDTPEAAAETVLWAAFYKPGDIADMILLPPEMLTDENSRAAIGEQLAKEIVRASEAIQGTSQQIWLDGGNKTTFSSLQQSDGKTYQYNDVLSFHLTGRPDTNHPEEDHINDMIFTKIDGMWKLVIPGLSPEIK
jgi:RNA polymerase sigma factor (sigma-70 family)